MKNFSALSLLLFALMVCTGTSDMLRTTSAQTPTPSASLDSSTSGGGVTDASASTSASGSTASPSSVSASAGKEDHGVENLLVGDWEIVKGTFEIQGHNVAVTLSILVENDDHDHDKDGNQDHAHDEHADHDHDNNGVDDHDDNHAVSKDVHYLFVVRVVNTMRFNAVEEDDKWTITTGGMTRMAAGEATDIENEIQDYFPQISSVEVEGEGPVRTLVITAGDKTYKFVPAVDDDIDEDEVDTADDTADDIDGTTDVPVSTGSTSMGTGGADGDDVDGDGDGVDGNDDDVDGDGDDVEGDGDDVEK